MRPSPFRLAIALITFIIGIVIFEVKHPTLIIPRQDSPHQLQPSKASSPCENDTVRALKEELRFDTGSAPLRSELADAYGDLGCYEEAVNAYQEALLLDPSDLDSRDNLGNAYEALGRYEEAIEDLRKNIRLDPKDAYAYSELGYLYNALDRYQDSLASTDHSLQLDARDAFAHGERADSYFHLKRYAEAAAEARQAVALGRMNGEDTALLNAGLVLMKLKQYEEATLAIQQSMESSSNNINAYSALAEIQIILGQREDASASYKRLLALKAETPDEHQLRGWAYLHLGDGSAAALEARDYLGKTHWKGHESPYAGLLAYFGYRQAGHNDKADEVLNEASAHEPFPKAWPQNIYRYLRREISAPKLLALASDNDERGEAHIYIGLDLALAGHADEALNHLKWLRENDDQELLEYADLISDWVTAKR